MKRFIWVSIFLTLAVAGLVVGLAPAPEAVGGFVFGMGVFSLNITLLIWMGRRLLQGPVQGGGGKPRLGAGFGAAILVKLLSLGLGAYLALVVFDFSALYFVAGALASLILMTMVAWSERSALRLFPKEG